VSDERREAVSPDESEDSPGFDIRDGPLARALDAGGIGLALIASASRQLLAANDAFCALCGYSADELRGLPLARLNHPDEPFDEAAFAALLASGSASGRQRRLAHRDGTVRWVLLSAQLLRGAGAEPPRIIAIVQDITAARLAQDALRSRERHLGFITGLNDALRGLDDPVALSFEAARRLGEFLGADRVGYAEDAGDGESVVVTRNFTRGVPGIEGRYRYDHYGPALLEAFRAGRTVVRPDIAHDPDLTDAEKAAHAVLGLGATVNVPLLKGGRLHAVFFVHARAARAWTSAEVALLEDVAERLRADIERARAEAALRATQGWLQAAHADLQRLLTALDTARDAERLRISRELHDDLLQSLAGMLLEAGAARLSLGESQPDLRTSLTRLEGQARGLIASTRRIIRDLRPLVIEELGLVAALESLVSHLPDLGGPVCTLDARSLTRADEQRLSPMAASLYRIAQEALTNVVKHAHARHAQLVLASGAGGGIQLTITDDGAGMPTPPLTPTDGFGLIGMQERVRALGGTLQLHAGARGGTVVTVTVPLP